MKAKKPKLFIIIPDGVSLRNFAYSNFYKLAMDKGYDITFWNMTPFNLATLGYKQELVPRPKLHWLSSILKTVRVRIELSLFEKRTSDSIYKNYVFPLRYKGLKNILKSLIAQLLVICFNSERGLQFIRHAINNLEQRTSYFKHCMSVLVKHQPDLVYCTSQRSVLAMAPLLAAKHLEIPTMCFIFSWDNLPKATLDVSADYYTVWSAHMKRELLYYYPFINDSQVIVTGTPQFEPHYNKAEFLSKTAFYNKYALNVDKTYLCYSGDDITTSPKDPLYLRDVAKAIRQLNDEGHNLGLIFRRCPVDFSNRYDTVIKDYSDIIVPIAPEWEKQGIAWDAVLPLPEDMYVLSNIARHCEAVINLGSSMVFDFAIHGKPCLYINYHYANDTDGINAGVHVYDFVHFRSMPNSHVVIWLDHPVTISNKLKKIIDVQNNEVVKEANKWFNIINKEPASIASVRIISSISTIINN